MILLVNAAFVAKMRRIDSWRANPPPETQFSLRPRS